jgi:hypothetical protein
MRRTTRVVVITLGLMMVLGASQLADARLNSQNAQEEKRVRREERDPATGAVFSVSLDSDSTARFTTRVGDFLLEKALASSGDLTLRLTQGKDTVTIAMSRTGYAVSRGKRSARFDPRSQQADGRDAVRAVLLGSPAIRTFRRLMSALENRDEREEEGPLIVSALADGALVQMLDGDTGATERIGKRLTRKRRAAMKAVNLKPDTLRDCVLAYELSLIDAWDLYVICVDASRHSAWWIQSWAENFCEWEWLIRSQQYVWQFVGCVTLPF